MSSSSSRIANLKYAANKNHNKGRVSNKFKKPLGNLSAYGIRTDTFYSQPLVEECCKEKEIEIELPKSYGNLILKISPATVDDKKKNPEIRSSLGIHVPVYEDDSEAKKNAIKTPHANYTLLHNLIFKTEKTDVKIVDYNREYVALPPNQNGWDDSLIEIAPGYRYYYAILSAIDTEIPNDKYTPLVYLNASPGSDFTLVDRVPVRNNKNPDNYLYTEIRLKSDDTTLEKKNNRDDTVIDIQ